MKRYLLAVALLLLVSYGTYSQVKLQVDATKKGKWNKVLKEFTWEENVKCDYVMTITDDRILLTDPKRSSWRLTKELEVANHDPDSDWIRWRAHDQKGTACDVYIVTETIDPTRKSIVIMYSTDGVIYLTKKL